MGYDVAMETKKYAQIINEVIMVRESIPTSNLIKPDVEVTAEGKHAGWSASLVTSGGRLQHADWLVSTIVRANKNSLSFSVQLPGGRGGYVTDILNQFVTEETVRAYAEHALANILEQNNWEAAA
jgi:hypothetical protein